LQDDEGFFTDISNDWDMADEASTRGFGLFDINGDGWLDLVKPCLDEKDRVYVARCGTESWIMIRLRDASANTRAIGSRVRVITADGKEQTRILRSGGTNYASSAPPELHFGLDTHEQIDRIEITWPDQTVTVLDTIDARQAITVWRNGA
jgi:hypothetical protein